MKYRLFIPLVLLCALHTVTADLQAQAGESESAGGVPAQKGNAGDASVENEKTKTPPSSPAEIVNAWCVARDEAQDEAPDNAQPDPCFVYHSLILQVKNLESWTGPEQLNPDQLLLVLNGVVLKGRLFGRPYDDPRGSGHKLLRFDLDRSRETAREEWKELMSRVKVYEPVAMSVGLAPATEPTGTTVGPQRLFWKNGMLSIQATSFPWAAFAALSYIGLLGFFVVLAHRSDILRGPASPGGRKPYSLGRFQMAWWFFIVIGSYVHIFIVLGDYNTLTAGVLTLIGISAATGFAGATMDTSSRVAAGEQLLEKEMLQKEQ